MVVLLATLAALFNFFIALVICVKAKQIFDSPFSRKDVPRLPLGIVAILAILLQWMCLIGIFAIFTLLPPVGAWAETLTNDDWTILLVGPILAAIFKIIFSFPWRRPTLA